MGNETIFKRGNWLKTISNSLNKPYSPIQSGAWNNGINTQQIVPITPNHFLLDWFILTGMHMPSEYRVNRKQVEQAGHSVDQRHTKNTSTPLL